MKSVLIRWLGLEESQAATAAHPIERAAAALMVEIMAADQECDEAEIAQIRTLVERELGVPGEDVDTLLKEAAGQQGKAHDLYQFTTVINEHYSPEEKFQLLRQLWLIAYADGRIDRYEESTIRKLAGLLYINNADFIRAKIEARDLGDRPSPTPQEPT